MELHLSTPDDPRSRRAISALSHSKPKPYRRPVYSDEPYRLSRLQTALLAVGATMIAGLIMTVAVIAQEHANATRGKEIIAAQPAEPITPHTAIPAAAFPSVPTPPMLDDSSLPMPGPHTPPLREAPAAAMPERLTMPRARPAPDAAAARPAAQPMQRPLMRAAPDPDVDLIATILLLTPPAPSTPEKAPAVCTPAEVLENICGKSHGMQP